MKRLPWTDVEIAFLRSGATTEQFRERFGEVRSLHGIRQKRDSLGLPSDAQAEATARVIDEPAAETVDPSDLEELTHLLTSMEGDVSDVLVERLFELSQKISDITEQLAPSTASVEHEFPDGLPIGVAFSGDWHIGGGGVDMRQLKADMTTIGKTDGLYAIGMGDYVDGVSIHSKAVSALYEASSVGARGLQNDMALIVAQKAAGKWLAMIDGNHDAWSERHAAIGCTRDFAMALDAPYFHQGGGSVYVTVGEQRYNLAVRHNAPGNSRLNTSNAQRRMFDEWPQWQNCDVICLAHFHFNDMHQPPRKGGTSLYLRSGTYKVRDHYAASGGFTPEWGVPVAVLYPDKRLVHGFRGDQFDLALRFLESERGFYRRKVA